MGACIFQAVEAAAEVTAEAELRQFSVSQLSGDNVELEVPISTSVGDFRREVSGALGVERPISLAIGVQILQPEDALLANFIQRGEAVVHVTVVLRPAVEVTRHVYHTADSGHGVLRSTDTVELDPKLPLRWQYEKFVPKLPPVAVREVRPQGSFAHRTIQTMARPSQGLGPRSMDEPIARAMPEIGCRLHLIEGRRPRRLAAAADQVHNLDLDATAEDAFSGGRALAVQMPTRARRGRVVRRRALESVEEAAAEDAFELDLTWRMDEY